jgi:hypothetical protein
VKSTTLDKWQPKWIETCTKIGNRIAAAYYERNLPKGFIKPSHADGVVPVENLIKAKYVKKEYAPRDLPAPNDILAQGRDPSSVYGLAGSGTTESVSDSFADFDFEKNAPATANLLDMSPKRTTNAQPTVNAQPQLEDLFAPSNVPSNSHSHEDKLEALKRNLGQAYSAAPAVYAAAPQAQPQAQGQPDWFNDFMAPAAAPAPKAAAPGGQSFDPFASLNSLGRN